MKSINTLSLVAVGFFTLTGAIHAHAETTPVMDEVLSVLQNKIAAEGGALNCKDSNGKAMAMTLKPNAYVAAFNYVNASDNIQNTPMPQNAQFGAYPAVTVNMTASSATAQTIVVVGKYRGNALTDFGDSPQDGDRLKTTTIQVGVAADGGVALNSLEVEEITYYQQVDNNNNTTTVVPGNPATFDYTCN